MPSHRFGLGTQGPSSGHLLPSSLTLALIILCKEVSRVGCEGPIVPLPLGTFDLQATTTGRERDSAKGQLKCGPWWAILHKPALTSSSLCSPSSVLRAQILSHFSYLSESSGPAGSMLWGGFGVSRSAKENPAKPR